MPAEAISKAVRADRVFLSPRRLIVLLMAAVLAVAWTVTAVWIVADRNRIYRSAESELVGAIPLLRMHARRSFDTAHTILTALDESLQNSGWAIDLAHLSDLALRMQSSDDDPIGIAVFDSDDRLVRIERT